MEKILTTLLTITVLLANGQSISDILSNCTEAKKEIVFINELNVFDYYDLEDYDTDLKKEVFKKSPEYAKYLSELKTKKADMSKTTYYKSQKELFIGTNYDIKKKGFNVNIGKNWGQGTSMARPPKSIIIDNGLLSDYTILLKGLPSKQVANQFMGQGLYDEVLFIPVDETNGLEIEENREKIELYYFFTPNGKEQSIYKYMCTTYGWYNMKEQVIKADKVRLILANNESGKIYFDKTYTFQPTITSPIKNDRH